MNFFEIYSELCASKGESANTVAKKLSIASGTVSEWKSGRVPRNTTLKKISQYFEVSVDYLLGKTDQKENPSDNSDLDEAKMREMCAVYSTLSPERQRQLDDYLAFLKSQQDD